MMRIEDLKANFKDRKVMVTGGCGFIGSNLVLLSATVLPR